jgi:hypothetical protein
MQTGFPYIKQFSRLTNLRWRASDSHRCSTSIVVDTIRRDVRVDHAGKLNRRVRVLLDRGDTHVFRLLACLQVNMILFADFRLACHFDQWCFETIECLNQIFSRFG